MVAAQEQHAMRAVEGLIIFAHNGLDPQTLPWTRIVRSFAFDELLSALEQRRPAHPLVAVFKPILVEDEKVLAESAVRYFRNAHRWGNWAQPLHSVFEAAWRPQQRLSWPAWPVRSESSLPARTITTASPSCSAASTLC